MRSLILGMLLLSGCATMFQPGPDNVRVNSKPEGAKVYLDGNLIGLTPIQVPVERKSEGIFKVEKEGFEPIEIDRDKVVAGWVWLNLLFYPGVAIDLICHNQGKYQETPIFAELIPKAKAGLAGQNIEPVNRAPTSPAK